MASMRSRRLGVVAAIAVLAAALSAVGLRPLHAFAAGPTNPCGPLWTDTSADAKDPGTGTQDGQLDVIGGSMTDNGTSLTTTLDVANLTTTVGPANATANDYYVVWQIGGSGTYYFTNVDLVDVPSTAITYNYGTWTSATGVQATGPADSGTFTSGSPGTVSVTIALSKVGSPSAGTQLTLAMSGTSPYAGYSTASETVTGTGVVFTVDGDISSFDYTIGENAGCSAAVTPEAPLTALLVLTAAAVLGGVTVVRRRRGRVVEPEVP